MLIPPRGDGQDIAVKKTAARFTKASKAPMVDRRLVNRTMGAGIVGTSRDQAVNPRRHTTLVRFDST